MRISRKLFKKYYRQLGIILFAFAVMTAVSYLYVSGVMKQELRSRAMSALNNTAIRIQAILNESETLLNISAYSVEDFLSDSEEYLRIQTFLRNAKNSFVTSDNRSFAFNSIYGYIQGEFFDGLNWGVVPSYDPESFPWYKGALEKEGELFFSSPAEQGGGLTINISKHLADGKQVIGVLTLDFSVNRLSSYVNRYTEQGYRILINEDEIILAHKDPELLGKKLSLALGEPKAILDYTRYLDSVLKPFSTTDYNGEEVFIRSRNLPNGWRLFSVIPVSAYYDKLNKIALLIFGLGGFFTVFLSVMLLQISEAKEAADAKSQSKSNFLARMSHEIRTPMNAILGMSELVLRDSAELSPKSLGYVNDIRRAGENLLSIINDILDFSKLESGRLEIVTAPYLLSSLINDVINILRTRWQEKSLYFTVNVEPSLPNSLIGDVARIRQVMVNLITNAVKYTDDGGITLDISAVRDTDGIKESKTPSKTEILFNLPELFSRKNLITLNISVRDTGIGIREEDKPRIFSEFVRVDLAKNNAVEGTGLGLAIARNLLQLMGGDLNFESVYGEGSVFTANIPQETASAEPFAKVANPNDINTVLYEPRTAYSDAVRAEIEALGVRCNTVKGQSELLEDILAGSYNYIILASFVYDGVRNIISKRSAGAKIVLLVQEGEQNRTDDVVNLVLPAYSLSLANLFNNVTVDEVEGRDKAANNIRFTAPEARILVVDDIKTNLSVMEGLLLPYKMKTELSLSGEDAVELVKKKRYDLIFMDHMMPGMDGIEASRLIHDLPKGKEVPVIALTANAVSGMKEMFIQSGMNDFLAKPVDTAKLNQLLTKWLPREKQLKKIDSQMSKAHESDINIPGINAAVGLSRTGGEEKGYTKILKLFCEDAAARIPEIRNSVSGRDIKGYTVSVHALKSAAASIGAANVSQFAADLEAAGNKEDVAFIEANTEKFLSELSALKESIGLFLKDKVKKTPKKKKTDNRSALSNDLPQLAQALSAMNISKSDEIMKKLLAMDWPKDVEDKLAAISQDILLFEYEKAGQAIEELLGSE
jgi:signal transduction histidine kinase/CheY-like chemotaxis protein/HPt (histidine-containing phosphotransfer) domain-containing protein